MKKFSILLLVSLSLNGFLFAQKEEDDKEKKPFKEHLFTGGSISLAFYNNTFLVGGSPVFGYNLTKWIDAGLVANYSYTSYRDYNYILNNNQCSLESLITSIKINVNQILLLLGDSMKFIPV